MIAAKNFERRDVDDREAAGPEERERELQAICQQIHQTAATVEAHV